MKLSVKLHVRPATSFQPCSITYLSVICDMMRNAGLYGSGSKYLLTAVPQCPFPGAALSNGLSHAPSVPNHAHFLPQKAYNAFAFAHAIGSPGEMQNLCPWTIAVECAFLMDRSAFKLSWLQLQAS